MMRLLLVLLLAPGSHADDACAVDPWIKPGRAAVEARRFVPASGCKTLVIRAAHGLMVRPGVREGLAKASWGRSTRRDVLGK